MKKLMLIALAAMMVAPLFTSCSDDAAAPATNKAAENKPAGDNKGAGEKPAAEKPAENKPAEGAK